MNDSKKGSELRFYSLAIVANNKELDSNVIQATPHERLTMLDGEIASLPYEQAVGGVDASGESYQSKVKVDVAVEAKWLPFAGSNRRTAPDVRRGERVILWVYADNSDYYWSSLDLDPTLRKLETVRYQFSGTSDENVDGTQAGNCYYLEVSTHKGLITLRTSQANKEFTTYVVQVNAKDGRIVITDKEGNEILLDSKETLISFKNADNTIITLDKQKMLLQADDSITVKAGNLIRMETKDYQIQASTYLLKSGTSTIDGTATFKGGKVTFENEVEFKVPIKAAGITSSAKIKGPEGEI